MTRADSSRVAGRCCDRGCCWALGGVSQALTGCTSAGQPTTRQHHHLSRNLVQTLRQAVKCRRQVGSLLAYFSRPGENYYYGGRRDLEVGNTEVLARIIAELIDCDVFRIEATDPYPDGYDATVARNVTEQNADARPAIANPLASIDGMTACCWAARSGMCDRR